jgi:S-(hydroxymethyl)glutathione dehydrogenase/alcohol dehydrogenase
LFPPVQWALAREAVVPIPDDVPFHLASLIGCAVMTGVGAAINTAKVTPGASVLVLGCGGVGISVIQGARIAGAAEIVAVDRVDSKLEQAMTFGATHVAQPDALGELMGVVTGGDGFDFGFEAIGCCGCGERVVSTSRAWSAAASRSTRCRTHSTRWSEARASGRSSSSTDGS